MYQKSYGCLRPVSVLQELIRKVLTRDGLSASELQIYKALSKWIDSKLDHGLDETEKKEFVAGIIRLKNMSIAELIDNVWSGGLVPELAILQAIRDISGVLMKALDYLPAGSHP